MNIEFYLAEDWRGVRTKKILNIKNMELFMKYIKIREYCFVNSKVCEYFYDDEVEAIKRELESEKRKLDMLIEEKKHRRIPNFKMYKEISEKAISQLEQLLGEYEEKVE